MDREVAFEAQEQVLAVGVDGADGSPGQPLRPAVQAVARVRRLDRADLVADERMADALRGMVDRVALGHGLIVGAAVARS